MRSLTPYDRGNPVAEQLDGMQDFAVRHRANTRLHQEALVPEDLVLKEDSLYDFSGASSPNEVYFS